MMEMEQESKNWIKNCTCVLAGVATCLTLVVLYALLTGEFNIGWSASSDAYRLLTGRTVVSPLAQTADPVTQAGENAQEVNDTAIRETEENETEFWNKMYIYAPAAFTLLEIVFWAVAFGYGGIWALWWINQLKKMGIVPAIIFFVVSVITVRGAWDMLMNGDLFYMALLLSLVAYVTIQFDDFISFAATFVIYVIFYVLYIAYQDTIHLFNAFQLWNVENWTEWWALWGIDWGTEAIPSGTEL